MERATDATTRYFTSSLVDDIGEWVVGSSRENYIVSEAGKVGS
jgi:hypothetical protein